MKTYSEVIDYLYARLPMFTRDGAAAINKGLGRTLAFCAHLGNPQDRFKSIHIAGTNGKGSSSHMLTSVLEVSGYKTGLYTSPHLLDFRERIRVHGEMVEQDFVVEFVNKHQAFIEEIAPSFFEVTVAMAFDYFAQQNVDIAVVEVGLGGRLDSTNIIHPLACLITNIGMDHMNMLGDTLEEIAGEKAGIIKSGTPVVVSEYNTVTAPVFEQKAREVDAPLCFADIIWTVRSMERSEQSLALVVDRLNSGQHLSVELDLLGSYQAKNLLGVLAVIDCLREKGYVMSQGHVLDGLRRVQQRTGLMGRWQLVSADPRIICDTGHNTDGVKEVVKNLSTTSYRHLHIVIGAMEDKDLSHMLPLLPQDATYYFCAPDMPRAMPAQELKKKAQGYGLKGRAYADIELALSASKANYTDGDLIFVGGSTFVVAEVLSFLTHGSGPWAKS